MGTLGAQVSTVTRKKQQDSMLQFAADRRCPACGRKAALIVVGWNAAGKIHRCRWCGFEVRPLA